MWVIVKNYGEEDEAFWDGEKWNSLPWARATIYLDEPIHVPEGGVAMRGFFNTKERDEHNHSPEGRFDLALDYAQNLPTPLAARLIKELMRDVLGHGADVVDRELDEIIAEGN